jgi:hypothetical protein
MTDWQPSFPDLPSLDAIGAQLIDAADRLDRDASGPRNQTTRRPRGAPLRRRRAAVIAVVLLLCFAGAAVAATELIRTGEPVPPTPAMPGVFGTIKPGSTKLLSVRAADPGGGPPWGLRIFRTTMTVGGITHNVGCVQVGRVVGGQLGVLGQDGSFNNDGKFHELPVEGEGCGSLDRNGRLFVDGPAATQVASADARHLCETVAQRQARTVDIPRALRASLRKKLRTGDQRAIRLERRLIAQQARRAAQTIPLCPTRDLRTITYGLVGPYARRVTATSPLVRRSVRPSPRENGAYLIVLAGPPQQQRPLRVQTVYANGLVCGRGASRAATPGCLPDPGYTEP